METEGGQLAEYIKVKTIKPFLSSELSPAENDAISALIKFDTSGKAVVSLFELKDHPTAKQCYAWYHEVEGTKKKKYFAVLKQHPVNSPQDAVRAAIVSDFKK
jgi:hypothetical protein